MRTLFVFLAVWFAFFAFLRSGVAEADRIDDMKKWHPRAACRMRADIFYGGIWAKTHDMTVEEYITDSEAESIKKDPKWTPLNDRERDYLHKHVAEGWKIANEYIEEKIAEENEAETGMFKGKIADVPVPRAWAQARAWEFFRSCLRSYYQPRPKKLPQPKPIKIQNEKFADDSQEIFPSLETTFQGCLHNMTEYKKTCSKTARGTYDAEIGRNFKICVQNKFWTCTGVYPL